MPTSDIAPPKKKTRGFASMSPEKRREVSKKGGKAVPKEKRAFSVDRSLAAKAGEKGGAVCPLGEATSGSTKGPVHQDVWIGVRAKIDKEK